MISRVLIEYNQNLSKNQDFKEHKLLAVKLLIILKDQLDNFKEVKREVKAWMKIRNGKKSKINWQFTAKDARVKLKRLYPSING